jgi:N-acetylglutamate synthase-like GNAT family acetyltransferase
MLLVKTQSFTILALLAVSPNSQGKGIGGILLEPILKQADSQGLPCYLETSTEKTVRFYQKHGFDIIWSGELLKNSPYWWAMKREPN